ncbi:MAG TPA: hypothetical protein VIM47_00915 [Dermatophilaceae bacterium]
MRTDQGDYQGDDGTITVALAALDRPGFDALVEAHPPTRAKDLWQEATFAPALIAASVTSWSVGWADEDPHQLGRIDVATARTWWDDWPVDAAEDLFTRCVNLNITSIEWARRRLDRDPRLAAEVAYCAGAGIPHSAFLGWAERDQDLALADKVRAADRCPGCNVPADLMGDPEAFEVVSQACVHCEAKALAEASIPAEHRHRYHHHLKATGHVDDQTRGA